MTGQNDRHCTAPRLRRQRPKPASAPANVSYRWDLTEDRLSWGPGAARFFGLKGMTRLRNGHAYTTCLKTAPGASPVHTILFSTETDEGFGVPYRTIYGFQNGDSPLIWVEDSGRWFAGRDGRPARAQGLLRHLAEAPASSPDRTEADFLTTLSHEIDALGQHSSAALFAFVPAEREAASGSAELHALRSVARLGDAIGLVGRMAILFARSCAPDRAADAAQRIAAQLSRETGQRLLHTAIRLPHDATHAMAALQKAERQLIAPDDAHDPLSRALRALNTRTLAMARQPIVAAGTRTPIFFEALARLNDGQGNPESMEDLIAALDAHGSIALLDHRMISLAIDALEAEPALHLAINVAPRSLAHADWFRYAEVRLSRRPDLASRLIVEITEQADLAILAHTRPQLAALTGWGVKIAIDDFGMGRTSLRHLAASHASMVKLAGSFVQNCGHSIEDRRIVGAMIDLAHQLGLTIVAEWVEDEPVARFLEERGVDFMQGRLFGAPVVPEAAHREHAPRRRSLLR